MAGKIKVVVKWPDEEYGHMTHISVSLKNLQKIVDGPIEYVPIGTDIVAIVNEEGAVNDLMFNCAVCGMPLFGTVIFAGRDPENKEHGMKDLPIDFKTFKKVIIGRQYAW